MNITFRNIVLNFCYINRTRVSFIHFCFYQKDTSKLTLKRYIHRHFRYPPKILFLDSSSCSKTSSVFIDTTALNIPSICSYSTVVNSVTECWNCNHTVESKIFCDYCGALQPVNKSADFFQIMGISCTYRINIASLRQKYRSLQTLLHPDKFSSKPKREQELSEEFSSIVNKAYSTLSDPLDRGLYLLSLHNVSIEEGTTDVDKMFLMEIMERNEEIENETDPHKLKLFYVNNKEQLDSLTSKVTDAFDSNNIEVAKELLTKMKYYHSIENKIKETKQKLNIPD